MLFLSFGWGIVLACATGMLNATVSTRLDITMQTVGEWRARFVARRLDGLLDEPRPAAPHSIIDAQIEVGAVVVENQMRLVK